MGLEIGTMCRVDEVEPPAISVWGLFRVRRKYRRGNVRRIDLAGGTLPRGAVRGVVRMVAAPPGAYSRPRPTSREVAGRRARVLR